jgi:hypothetical protein
MPVLDLQAGGKPAGRYVPGTLLLLLILPVILAAVAGPVRSTATAENAVTVSGAIEMKVVVDG